MTRTKSLGIGAIVVALILGGLIGRATTTKQTAPETTSSTNLSSLAARASASAHNDQDVTFAQSMVPHHEQALAMAQLADSRAASQQVKDLAKTIEGAQQPEITAMNGWLSAWNAASSSSMSGMDMSSGSMSMDHSSHGGMTGMMSQADMDRLATLSGSAFDRQFLTMMIMHHEGAVAMAKTELSKGQAADAVALAASIQISQQAQITQMRQLLGKS